MTRSRLQSLVLYIWLGGLVCLELTVGVAIWRYEIDAFKVEAKTADEFENTFKGADPKVGADVKRVLLDLARGTIDARSKPEFREKLKRLLPKEDMVTSDMLSWAVNKCAQEKISGLGLVYFQIYLPWLAIMLAGLLGESGSKQIPLTKYRASIGFSIVLQLVFLMVLLNTLVDGDLNGTRDIQLVATLITAFVAILVQFVFPSAPHIPAAHADGATHAEGLTPPDAHA